MGISLRRGWGTPALSTVAQKLWGLPLVSEVGLTRLTPHPWALH